MGISEEGKFSPDLPPVWMDGDKLDEGRFADEYLRMHPMRCFNRILFDEDGCVNEDRLSRNILGMVRDYRKANLPRLLSNLVTTIKITCAEEILPYQTDRIHVSNGTLFLDDEFREEKEICINRLPVRYNVNAPPPERWRAFLHDLLEDEDILTLQEYMGYLLIPTNKAQKMLLILGKGGEGKSVIGLVLQRLLGNNMNVSSIQSLTNSRFQRAAQEFKLLMLDDDMQMEALQDTGYLKSLITLEGKTDLERKGQQSVQGELKVRFMGFANGTLEALYDRSYGFFRRQLILRTKDQDENREDDPFIIEKLEKELEGIFLWCLDGLKRLITNQFRFTQSNQAKENLKQAIRSANNIVEFLEDRHFVRFEAGTTATTRQLYAAYQKWCDANLERVLSQKTFANYLSQHQEKLGIQYRKNIPVGMNQTARGYEGIHAMVRDDV